jgi:hypothetical protein
VTRDVLDHHHRVVDQDADPDGEAAERHQVERVAGKAQDEEGLHERDRDRERSDRGGTQALQEQQQGEHAERAFATGTLGSRAQQPPSTTVSDA